MPAESPDDVPEALPVPGAVSTAEVQRAVERAQRVLWHSQRPDGSWDAPGQVGPWITAQVVVALRHVGELSPEAARDAARWLVGQQRQDGSFAIHPFAPKGDLGATACGWAALHLTALPEHASALASAAAWVERAGGVRAVVGGMARGDFAAVFLALAGLVDPRTLPIPRTAALLAPPVVGLLQTRFHAGVIMGALQLEVLLRRLRGDWGPDGTRKGLLGRATCAAMLKATVEFQNHDGSWNDSVGMTAIVLPALAAAGLTPADPVLRKAVDWVKSQWVAGAQGITCDGFGTEVWSTAFNVRALLATGASPADPDVQRALEWIVSAQLDQPMPRPNNRKKDAPRTGGWAFQRTNHTMPDCDDTGVALSALARAARWQGEGALHPQLRERIGRSLARGRDWLFGMQNPDGGWSAFVWGLPGKRPGPALITAPEIRLDDPLAMLRAVWDPPMPAGDPSTEDLTSRVLHGLGAMGLTVADPRVARAVTFLQRQQCPDGSFWGRWVVNYLSATAFVLMGLRAVNAELEAPWVRRAVRWVLSRQNPDGGWGETEASYAHPELAGKGPSMAPLTGLVLQGLIEAGEGGGDAVRRGVAYLLAEQQPDGTWPNGKYLHTNVPPDTFYVYLEAARFYPTEALGMYLAHQRAPMAAPPSRWNDPLLDAMRQTADPTADAVIRQVFSRGQVDAVNALLGQLFRADAPVPPGLPDEVARYFQDTAALPDWADPGQIALAQQLFARAGWEVAAALFCSSLPQAYAAAKGARVLTQTQEMTRHVHQRIFETAQFLFDVLDEGALGPAGRGVRTVQKVRLMHAGIRHLLLERGAPAWEAAQWGLPVNQEDLAGTLMTFSVVTLQGVGGLGISPSPAEAGAWLHFWRVIGHLLGIHPEVLPGSLADAEALMETIRERHWAPSAEGRTLIRPLLSLMQGYFPGRAMDGLPVALVRHLAGDHCADLLGLPPADWTRLVLEATTQLDRLFDPAGRDRVSRLFGGATGLLMRGIVAADREGKQARFRIPAALMRQADPR